MESVHAPIPAGRVPALRLTLPVPKGLGCGPVCPSRETGPAPSIRATTVHSLRRLEGQLVTTGLRVRTDIRSDRES